MTGRHLIESAVFDTTYRVSLDVDERARINEFIKSDLLEALDEIFGEVDNSLTGDGKVLRLENLELDLGMVSRRDYRRQLPLKLREQLSVALTDISRSASRHPRSTTALIDARGAEAAQLFYFLRHGHLPWYSRGTDAEKLEALLVDTLDTAPASLLEFLHENAGQSSLLERLKQQFSEPVVGRVMQLFGPDGAPPGIRGADIEAVQAQLVSGLLSGDRIKIAAAWRVLFAEHAERLERTIRFHGQRQIVRRHLVAGLSSRQFDDLLALLESGAQEFLRATIERVAILAARSFDSDRGEAAHKAELQEYTLAHLLVERASRFAEKTCLESLIRQFARTRDLSMTGLLQQMLQSAEITDRNSGLYRALTEIYDQAAARPEASSDEPADRARAYRQAARIRAVLAMNYSGRRASPGLVEDIRTLAAEKPWLMLRLFRELQAGRYDWRPALKSMPVDLLAALVDAFLSLNNQAAAAPMDDLISAVRGNLEKSKNRQIFYLRILTCLINGERIDFDAILGGEAVTDTAAIEAGRPGAGAGAVEATAAAGFPPGLLGMDTTALDRMLQCAELLTTASLGAGISLPLSRLDALKWRFIEDYAIDSGYLFSEKHFTLQYVESLLRQLDPVARSEVRAALVASLGRDSLQATRATAERLVDILTDRKPTPTQAPESRDSNDEPAVLEDIHITNSGAVLLAPFLPRLFERLGLTEANAFIDRDAAERAVHCLQFLVDGSLSSPEYRLVLNKLLCGVRPGLPIRTGIELAVDEKQQLEGLLQAVIHHWGSLGNTSIDGLRESFLQRSGRLQRINQAWQLSVEGKPYDMLLDALPWSYSTIRLAWMDRPIYVEWR